MLKEIILKFIMLHNSHQLQFFMSTDADCPYLEGKRERKLFTSLNIGNAERVQNALSQQGFRRSQNIVYRPVCQDCAACMSARIPAEEFQFSKNQKRILARGRDFVREVRQPKATDEQFELFERYVKMRHFDGGMSDMGLYDFASMIEETNVPTRIIEYRKLHSGRPGELVAVSLTDIFDDGLSMVYSFFDPELSAYSLGTYMILDHINLCKHSSLKNLYLGYWVKNSPNMDYKARYRPLELYHNGIWKRFHDLEDVAQDLPNSQQVLFKALKSIAHISRSE